jgi:hypothetical protein
MNERIIELAEQAGFNLPNNLVEGQNGPGVRTERDKLEKFAELIVRECCDIVHRKTDESIRVVMAIEQHFGVEE